MAKDVQRIYPGREADLKVLPDANFATLLPHSAAMIGVASKCADGIATPHFKRLACTQVLVAAAAGLVAAPKQVNPRIALVLGDDGLLRCQRAGGGRIHFAKHMPATEDTPPPHRRLQAHHRNWRVALLFDLALDREPSPLR